MVLSMMAYLQGRLCDGTLGGCSGAAHLDVATFELALMHHGIRQHEGAAQLQCRHCRFESHFLMHVARGIVQHTIAFQISVVHS